MLLNVKYKELLMIKHALQLYVERDGATLKDIKEEKRLLNKVENEIELNKERYGIK